MSGDQFVKATVVTGENKITFEGPPAFVEAQVARFVGLSQRGTGRQGKEAEGSAAGGDSSARIVERELIEEKQPQNHPETVAVLAFGLLESGQSEFSDEDIRKAYIRAGIKPPKVVSQAIRDARNHHEFIEASGQRGSYRLSHHGERMVRFDLPRKR